MINLFTKFEVSKFTHYDGAKGNAKCRNWGSLGRLGVTQSHRQHNNSIKHIDFLFDLNRNFYRFQVIANYLSNVVDFNLRHLHFGAPFGLVSLARS